MIKNPPKKCCDPGFFQIDPEIHIRAFSGENITPPASQMYLTMDRWILSILWPGHILKKNILGKIGCENVQFRGRTVKNMHLGRASGRRENGYYVLGTIQCTLYGEEISSLGPTQRCL